MSYYKYYLAVLQLVGMHLKWVNMTRKYSSISIEILAELPVSVDWKSLVFWKKYTHWS